MDLRLASFGDEAAPNFSTRNIFGNSILRQGTIFGVGQEEEYFFEMSTVESNWKHILLQH